MLILSGPTAAGKNTVGRVLAQRRLRCAVVDFDAVRAMFVQPHHAPWQGSEGRAQQLLGVQLVSRLAGEFASAGWDVIILDVLTMETAAIYRHILQPFAPRIVQLLPSFAELELRFHNRGPCLTADEFTAVYRQQQQFTAYDQRIDNSTLSLDAVADRISALL